MVMTPFGCKTATKYIPDMKELILSGEKCQTGRLCKCKEPDFCIGDCPPSAGEKICQWHRLKVSDLLHLYWKPRQKKQWEKTEQEWLIQPVPNGMFTIYPKNKNVHNPLNVLHWEQKNNLVQYLTKEGTFKVDIYKKQVWRQVGGCEFLGKAKVTEIITIEMWKKILKGDPDIIGFCFKRCGDLKNTGDLDHSEYWPGYRQSPFIRDLAVRDGFRDGVIGSTGMHERLTGTDFNKKLTAVEKMFAFFDESYDLSIPKTFVFPRWKPLWEVKS